MAVGTAAESAPATWLRASRFGDSQDRVVVRSNGLPTYLLPDTAYHRDKHARGFRHAINLWGPDHHAYVRTLRAALLGLGLEPDFLEVGRQILASMPRSLLLAQLYSSKSGDLMEVGAYADWTRLTFDGVTDVDLVNCFSTRAGRGCPVTPQCNRCRNAGTTATGNWCAACSSGACRSWRSAWACNS